MAAPKGHPRYGGRKVGSRNVKVLARLAREQAHAMGEQQALAEIGATAERTMLEMACVAYSDVALFYDDEGNLLPVRRLPSHVRRALASVKTLKTNVVSGDGQQEVTREVRLWDKVAALNSLMKHFGLITDKHEVTVGVSAELLAILNRRKAAQLPAAPAIERKDE